MPKISKEEIIKAVERYKRGETSQKAEAKKQGVSHQTFQDWLPPNCGRVQRYPRKAVQSKTVLSFGSYCRSACCHPQKASCLPEIHPGSNCREYSEQRIHSQHRK